MCIWSGGGELALVPKINPGNPVPGRGGDGRAHFETKRKRPRQTFTSLSRETGKAKSQGTRDRD